MSQQSHLQRSLALALGVAVLAALLAPFAVHSSRAAQTEPVTYTKRADGSILKDGEPFFIIGFDLKNQARDPRANLATLADAGFNTVSTSKWRVNSTLSDAEYRAVLDTAAQRGIAVIQSTDSRTPNIDDKVAVAQQWGTHPATMGYYISDDSHQYVTPQQLRAIHTAMKTADPNHLTLHSDWGWTDAKPMYGIADVSMPYWYPVHTDEAPLGNVDLTNRAAGDACPTCTLVPYIQTFPWPGKRWPTTREVRNMTYQSIVAGAKGIMYYEFDGMDGDLLSNPELWSGIKGLVPELQTLTPALLDGDYTRTATDNDEVIAAYWQYQGAVYVVVVNLSESAQTIGITLPEGAPQSLQSLFEQQPSDMRVVQGKLSGTIASTDARVFVLGTTNATPTPPPPPTATSTPPTAPPTATPKPGVFLPMTNKLTLFNAATDQLIGDLKDGATINLKQLGTSQLSVVATTNPAKVGSVTFALDGQVIQTENFVPYSIAGDAPKQGGRNYMPWTPTAGTHTLVVTPYSQAKGQGQAGQALKLTFTVVP